MTHEIPERHCPKCGTAIAVATNVNHNKKSPSNVQPHPGALSICMNCGTVMEFTPELEIRVLTAEELEMTHPLNRQEITAIRQVIEAMKTRTPNDLPPDRVAVVEAGKTFPIKNFGNARIYAVDGMPPYIIHGAIFTGSGMEFLVAGLAKGGWEIASWDKHGKNSVSSMFDLDFDKGSKPVVNP